jgi:ABC-2 type transport system permease protein
MRTLAIARRDFAAYFLTPVGYVVTALYLLFTGAFFLYGFQGGHIATMRPVFEYGAWALLFIGPAISMRMFSEELRSGTAEMLMTAPVGENAVVAGKFLAASWFLLVMLLPTGVYVIALEIYGRPDYGELAAGYLGVFCAGLAYLASGIFASTLTSSQLVAFMVALFFWLALSVGAKLAPQYLPGDWARVAAAIDPDLRLRDFAIGLIDTANIAFFAAIALFFLAGAAKSLEARRWR